MTKETHEGLIVLVHDLFESQGLKVQDHIEYKRGEMDLLCNDIYYEVKSNNTPKSEAKAREQIERAMKYGQCVGGFLVTYDGVVKIK